MPVLQNRKRFRDVLSFKKADDRLPVIEWAAWWDATVNRWKTEGLPQDIEYSELNEYFGLDRLVQFWLSPSTSPEDCIEKIKESLYELKELHDKGEIIVWITLEGFFWYPRSLLGIEEHFYTFYDDPELMHRLNRKLTEFNIQVIEEFCKIIIPDFMTFAEDMSYNKGPMISYELFKDFLLPYYKQVVPVLKKYNIITIIDTDGNVEEMIPWLIEAGIEGVLPLERQAGVEVERIRRNYPNFLMIGGYDKMVMNKGEAEMRKEFERLMPVMKSGGFIPSCDHQTPPGVSLENYRIYLRLLNEYCEKAIK
ncbi:MAG: uroporphyrinogen decarboxylase family protein [Clostridiales bacterium]|nr:uroporphyrinogen decarboxylase family protein [Clostridiales bacterium]